MSRKTILTGSTAIGSVLLAIALASIWIPFRWWRSVPDQHGIRVEVYGGRLEATKWWMVSDTSVHPQRMRGSVAFGYEKFVMPGLTSFDWKDKAEVTVTLSLNLLWGAPKPGVVGRTVYAPLWPLPALLLAYPSLAFIRGPLRRWRRRKRGLCIHCGYNLTGLTEPRCPECGTAVDLGKVDRQPATD